ncbi:hypothetical protein L1049_011935 [Liquidambar formosana]|uniref:Uncharacterized protein n=1 Tax=Liquidambar formosana TaxID=63359 RepID=A0AAP0RZ29_LIQFO
MASSVEIEAAVEAITIPNVDPSNQTQSITYMNPSLYEAAASGDIDALKAAAMRDINAQAAARGDIDAQAAARGDINDEAIAEYLRLRLTPNKNTVLHIHITAQCENRESTVFVEKVLAMCPLLLWQANAKGETLLHIAARYGRFETVKLLIERAKLEELEAGVGLALQMIRSMTKREQDTALHDAVRFNHAAVVEILTDEDPEFSYPANDAGETPLYLAAERGFGDLVSQILRTTSPRDHGGPNGTTALHAAVINNDEGMTEKILQKKPALTKEADRPGWTPLHYAARFGYLPIELRFIENLELAGVRKGQRNITSQGRQHTDLTGSVEESKNERLSALQELRFIENLELAGVRKALGVVPSLWSSGSCSGAISSACSA